MLTLEEVRCCHKPAVVLWWLLSGTTSFWETRPSVFRFLSFFFLSSSSSTWARFVTALRADWKRKLKSWWLYGSDRHKAVDNGCKRLRWRLRVLAFRLQIKAEQMRTQLGVNCGCSRPVRAIRHTAGERREREKDIAIKRDKKVHGRRFTEHRSQMWLHRWHPPSWADTTNKPSRPLCVYVIHSYSAAHNRGSLLEGSYRIRRNYSKEVICF